MKIYFKDEGQDFLEWRIKKINKELVEVTESLPFQNFVWKGQRLRLSSLKRGKHPIFENGDELREIIKRVEK